MTKEELAGYNIGENLDALMNLDPRGYGVCRILYAGSRKFTGKPLSMNAAGKLFSALKPGDPVYIITGFVLLPHRVPETDGFVSSMLLSRALTLGFGVKPVIICPEESRDAVRHCASVVGLHYYEDLDTVRRLPLSLGCVVFTKDMREAEVQADQLISGFRPAAVLSIEAPGANRVGQYHNSVGINVTELEAKSDVLFEKLKRLGVPNFAIGDLGNECGMGAIAEHIRKYIPYASDGECKCGCGGGILSSVGADNLITATTSDWGCYALIAALAYLKGNADICQNGEMEAEVMRVGARNGMIDMTGSLIPGIDGFDSMLNRSIVELMRQCVAYALKYDGGDGWFEGVIRKNYFAKVCV